MVSDDLEAEVIKEIEVGVATIGWGGEARGRTASPRNGTRG
jgi:hypothetical protein